MVFKLQSNHNFQTDKVAREVTKKYKCKSYGSCALPII